MSEQQEQPKSEIADSLVGVGKDLPPATAKSARTPPKGKPTPKRPRVKASDYRENRTASATKRGPGRYAKHGAPGSNIGIPRPTRAYKALMNAWADKRVTKAKHRDEHGAYTLVGYGTVAAGGVESGAHFASRVRRIWLAGISAQRGF